MTTKYDYDLVVIGAGSGGVRAARIASGHGARVAIVEEHKIGGTCVVRGCVPKKLLVYGAHFAEDLEDAVKFGWCIDGKRFEWSTLRDNVLAEVSRLSDIYTQTLANHKVEILRGHARIAGEHSVQVDHRTLSAGVILIATGARPERLDFPGNEHSITSNEAFHLEALPRRIAIVGAGYIANEFAGVFHSLGSEVVLINRSDQILRGYDQQIRDRLLQISMARGIRFLLNTAVERMEKQDEAFTLTLSGGMTLPCDAVLVATGRAPNTEGLGLDSVGVQLDRKGGICVDGDHRTTCPSIYAIGDVTNRVQLTPVAIREGQAFAESVFGHRPTHVDYMCIPSAVFSHPPLAAVGLTESEARNKLGAVKVFTADFRPMKQVLAGRDERSLYKVVVDADTDRIVGAHMIGPDVPEILQVMAVAVKAGLRKAQLDECIALHPTMAEELVLMR